MSQRTSAACGFVLLTGLALVPQERVRLIHAAPTDRGGTVIIAGRMPDPDLVALSVMTAAATPDADFLLDTHRAETTIRPFFDRSRPEKVIPVGAFPEDHDPAKRWGVTNPVAHPPEADPVAYAWSLFPKADRVVVAPRKPHAELLQAARLAGTLKVPLFVLRDRADPIEGLKELLTSRGVKEVIAVGTAAQPCRNIDGVKLTELADAVAVAAVHRKELLRGGPIRTLILANPADPKRESTLAPWVAVRKRAALLLTGPDGKDAAAVVAAALKDKDTATADSLLVLAGPEAIPATKRDNPAAGKDEQVDVEPWVPHGPDLLTLAAGRLFHDDRAVLPLVFARQRLFEHNPEPTKVLIASNPGDGLPLLETFSRNTGRQLANAGCKVTGLYGKANLTGPELRALVPQSDIFLWEGHYRTLVDTYEMPKWTEPLRPSIIFLQSCLALNPAEAGLLFDRGAVAVVGSPNRTYSGSGGACSLGFLDALASDGRPAGAALRHAKNFLLCYAELKEKRLGEAAKLGGANRRAAWTFTLWGDPTLNLPRPTPPADALPPLKYEVTKSRLILTLPAKRYPSTEVGVYRSEMWPGGRLAGLFSSDDDANRHLIPFAFAEVGIPDAPDGKAPRLTSKVPARNYLLKWDARRKVAYLLLLPRAKDTGTIEFQIHWDTADPN